MLVLAVVNFAEVNKKAIYSGLAIANESATVTYILTEAQRQTEEWMSFKKKKGTL